MRALIVSISTALFILLAALIGTLLIGLGFLGIGWLFSRLFPLTQYEATIVALGAGAVLGFVAIRTFQVMLALNEEEEYEPAPGGRAADELERWRATR